MICGENFVDVDNRYFIVNSKNNASLKFENRLKTLQKHNFKTDYLKAYYRNTKLRKRLKFFYIKKSRFLTKYNDLFRSKSFESNLISPSTESNYYENFNYLDTIDAVSIDVSTRTYSTVSISNSSTQNILNISTINDTQTNVYLTNLTKNLKLFTNILLYLKINQCIFYINNKLSEILSRSNEDKCLKSPLKRNYLNQIILKPDMLNDELDKMVILNSKKNNLSNCTKLSLFESKLSAENANNQIIENYKLDEFNNFDKNSQDFLENILSHKMRCFSEPPNLNLQKFYDKNSPALKILFNNLIQNDQLMTTHSLGSLSIEDFLNIYKCNNLNLKRSFSSFRIKLEKDGIKKSPSFEKFLKNVVQGKKKSNSLCNFSVKKFEKQGSESVKDSNSNSSENLDDMMISLMNGRKKSSWPILKIEDSTKSSIAELEKTYENGEVNINEKNEGYIPDNVRNALEQAGINIEEIIKMTTQLQMSLNNDLEIINSNFNTQKFDKNNDLKEQITTTKTIFTSEEKIHLEKQLENLIDNIKNFDMSTMKEDDESNLKSGSELVSISNLRTLEIHQNLSAKISERVENKNIDVNDNLNTVRSNRKKSSSNNRYATVSNFTVPDSMEKEAKIPLSPSWNVDMNTNWTQDEFSKILPAKSVNQFKPIVNIHKRLSTTPVTDMNLISSNSTEQFSNIIDSDFAKEEPDAKFIKLNDVLSDENISTVDLTKSLPGRNKKKVSVTRSFSYNIGKIYSTRSGDGTNTKESKKSITSSDSFSKMIEFCKNKTSIFSDNTESSQINEKTLVEKKISSFNSDRVNTTIVAGRLNNAVSPNLDINQGKKNLIALLNSDTNKQDNISMIPQSKSANNIPNSLSSSSLTGLLLNNNFEIYPNSEDFHH
ncbi:unnamed protein product, partial [Brachionus calyciflorus]